MNMGRIGAAADFGAGRIVGKQTPLKALLPKLERPMLCVSFVWFLVIVAELVGARMHGCSISERCFGS